MTDFQRSPAARALDQVVEEAKAHLDVGQPDWSALEAKVMAAVEAEKPAVLAESQASSRRAGLLRVGALGLALAAALALFVRGEREEARTSLDLPAPARGESASSIRALEGGGEARVDGIVATAGLAIHAGSSLEVMRGRAMLERPRKVSWLVEPATAGAAAQAKITAASDPLVVSLAAGAVEAQVAPVASGEAFAVDITTERGLVRVAVHGTHLRVERIGSRVVVDLTEGVISIGVPPRTGSTYGTIVNAPAHVELDATDLATLKVDHDPKSVRPAVALGPPAHEPLAAAPKIEAPTTPSEPAVAAPSRPHGEPSPAKVDGPKPSASPRDVIVRAIRDCAAASGRHSSTVQVTATSTLELHVSAAGAVESAQFTPPLSPEIQNCAARTIYKTKLDETGAVTIPLELTF